MLLHEIIEANKNLSSSIITEELHKYKKLLYVYYSREFLAEPVLMVTDVFNACSYARIVSGENLLEEVDEYVNTIPDLTDEDKEDTHETIMFNSIFLKDF